MRRISKLGIVGSGVCALALTLASPAFADYAPRPLDVVGVGSDTVQNINDFVADGDPFGDGAGYNGAGNKYKMVSFDATPDANDRAGYGNPSSNSSLNPLSPTIVLRQGTVPVQRPNGSGAGIAALIADTAHKINYVRASRALKATEETSYETANPGDKLDTVEISTDPLEIAYSIAATNPSGGTNPASNIPAAGLTVAQLTAIYTCSSTARTWNQVGGTSTNNIVPLIPQAGSGTRSTFLADISVTTPGPCVQTVEENDPNSIATASQPSATVCSCTTVPANGTLDPADAIVPFSAGRLALWNGVNGNPGYFHSPTAAYPGTSTALSPGIAVIAGVGTGTSQVYNDVRGLFIILRNSDVNSGTAWQPGGTLNWAKTLFWGSTSYYGSGNGDPFITAAGGVPLYVQEPVGYAPN
jgi:hypothetical protein